MMTNAIFNRLYKMQLEFRQRTAGRMYAWRHMGKVRPGSETIFRPESVKRCALIIAGLIGDTVMCTPVIQGARRIFPGAKITLIGFRHNCELLSACPLLDSTFEVEPVPFSLRRRREEADLVQSISSQNFDLAVILLGDHFALALAQAGIPERIGVRGTALEGCLTQTYRCTTPETWGPIDRMNSLRVLRLPVESLMPKLWVEETSRRQAKEFLQKSGLPYGQPYLVLHPFGSRSMRYWPLSRVDELSSKLLKMHGLQTVVIGTDSRGTARPIQPGNAIDATGTLPLGMLLAIIESADLVVSTDSGPFHIAGALNRPLLGLFRSRYSPYAGLYPGSESILGRHPRCESKCRQDRCEVEPCRQMEDISVDTVMRHLDWLIFRQLCQKDRSAVQLTQP